MSKSRDLGEFPAAALDIDASGNLDVTGTVTADGLTVDGLLDFGSGTNTGQLGAESGGVSVTAAGKWRVRTNGGTTRQTIESNGDVVFYEDTGTTPKFFWDASAENLGIGTSSPDTILHVESTTPVLRLTNPQSTSSIGTSMGKIEFETRDSSAVGVIGYIDVVDSNNYGTAFDMTFGTGGSGSAVERLRINSSGNVGIGTSLPAAKLHLASGSALEQRIVHEGNGTTVIRRDGSTSYLLSESGGATSRNLAFGYQTSSGSAITETMRIDSSGIVTTPNQPAFLARLPGTNPNLVVNGWAKFNFNAIDWDRNNNFSTANSRFTAPVSGIYYFNWLVQVQGMTIPPAWYYANPLVNGSTSAGSYGVTFTDQRPGADYYYGIKGSQSLNLVAGDYVELQYYWTNGNGTVHGGTESQFSGHLIG